ncbi:hypothetical protein BKA65DRAFT_146981 [Rhexocercosporidium sp. MPI-PUGE-AT-0058]|nr:hypothetical protein BKA65DRAFT_146981 [Rhexocercosporidium sp. MPI-PUGE-AT-0058]
MPQDDSPDSVSYNLPAFEMPTTSSPDHGGTRFTNASIPLCSSANTASSDSLRRGREYSFSRSAVESTDGILTPTTGDSHSESSHLPPSVNGDRIDEVTDYKDTITPNTHTTTFTDSSIPTIETFATDLQSAIDSAWPIPASTRIRARHQYKAVHVMLLSWEDGNPGIWGEMKRLEHTFSELYHFEVEECRIPNRDPGKALMGRVERFVERGDGEGKLLIVCYAGAVGMGRLGEGALWTANYLTDSPRVASAGVQKMFEEATADALMLFDSPFSPDPISQEGQGVTEVLAACGIESHSPLVGPDSFTSSLIKELEEAFTGSPISVAELHGRMTSSARDRKPELLRNTHGTLVPDENGQLIYAPSMKRTPVHSFLTDGVRRRSIVLTPQPVRGIRNTMSFPKAGRRTDTWAEWSCDTQSQSAKPTWPSKYPIAKPIANATQHPRVLLSVRIEENYFPSTDDNADSVWKWCEWLRDIPSGLDPVAVEAVYRSSSTSTLLIVNLPFLVWDMLPENEAYSFIGFVDSKNLQDVVGEPHVPVAVPVPDAQSKSERKRDEREIEREVSKRVEAQMAARELVSLRKEKEEWVRKAEREREAALARPHSLDKPRDGREEVVKAKAPIRFKDAVGRKLCFPFHMASTWMVSSSLSLPVSLFRFC